MLQKTNGIVLRSVKYGDSSLICTIFTEQYGVQAYMLQGVRSTGSRTNRAASFQPGMLLDLVVYHQPHKNIQRIREFQPSYIYTTLQEHVVKNSIVLFSVELLLRLLPEQAPLHPLFDFAYGYFIALDKSETISVANFPLYFIVHCSRFMGYELKGNYTSATPHLNMQEGGYTEHSPAMQTSIDDLDAFTLSELTNVASYENLVHIQMNAAMRNRLIDWYVSFLQLHTEHMGAIRSLPVLRAILHG